MYCFRPEHIQNLCDRAIAHEQLKALGDVWIGRDVVIAEEVLVPPSRMLVGVPLVVSSKDFPNIDLTRGALNALRWSVRSCLAQSGVEVLFHQSDMSEMAIRDLRKGRSTLAPVAIINHSPRPILLEGSLMRFFWVNDRRRLRFQLLRQTLGTGLVIDGEEGAEWTYGDADLEDDLLPTIGGLDPALNKDLCIRLRLEHKFHIPESKRVFCVRSKADLPKFLKPINGAREPHFAVGETAKVQLGPDYAAVIELGFYRDGQKHIRSPLIDPGFAGPIRTETLGGLDHVEIYLYRCNSRPSS
ncbi:MAG: hypothetical protein WCT02_00225 [Candidatus Paceibacterota bacterium]